MRVLAPRRFELSATHPAAGGTVARRGWTGRITVRAVTYADRLLNLAESLGYQRPNVREISNHAAERWRDRWRPGRRCSDAVRELKEILHLAVIVEVNGREKSTIWELPEGARLVVDRNGTIKTVLPPGAVKRRYRPAK